MTESAETFRETRALAAELLRAQRHGDQVAFNAAMLRAEGNVPALLVSLCGLSNRVINDVIGRAEADVLIDRVSSELPAPGLAEDEVADVWRDEAALVAALHMEDLTAARNLTVNTPNLPLLNGFVMHVLAIVLDSMDPTAVAGLIDGMRLSEPPL